MTKPIYNDLTGPDLNVTVLADPERIRFHRENVAGQINHQRMSYFRPKEVVDLSDWIGDIIIETTVQGASLLEVHIIDPGWILLQRDEHGTSFFDVDEAGYIWPPIELNFPPDVSDAQWRICQLRPSTDLGGANLICVFEDKVAAVLREFSGPVLSHKNETRAEFIHRLVKEARVGGPLSATPGLGKPQIGTPDGSIRFVARLPNVDFTAADLTADEITLPKSAKQPHRAPARGDPNKKGDGNKGAAGTDGTGVSAVVKAVNGVALSIEQGLGINLAETNSNLPPAWVTPPATFGSGPSFG